MDKYVWPFIVLILGIFVISGVVQSLREWADHGSDAYYSQYHAQAALPPCGPAQQEPPNPQEHTCNSSTDYGALDLAVQNEMAIAAQKQLFVTGVELALIFTTIVVGGIALRQARDISRRELRAYLSVVQIDETETTGGVPTAVAVYVKNAGKTPAIGIRTFIDCMIERGEFVEKWHESTQFDAVVSIGPEQPLRCTNHLSEKYPNAAARGILRDIWEGRTNLWYYATWVYRDIYGEAAVTRVRVKAERNGDVMLLQVCESGNDII